MAALLLTACAESPTAPTPQITVAQEKAELDVGGNPNANATLLEGRACTLNVFACPTPYADWWLKVNSHGDSFTDDYNGPGGDHVIIKAIWIIPDVWYQVVDEKGKVNGAKLEQLVVTPHGLGQAHKP
jgi:hypothetical protein